MKRSLLVLILALSSFVLYGQNITGRIINNENQPVKYANVVALTSDSLFLSGVTSDELGNFNLILPEQKTSVALLKISFVGYDEKYLVSPKGDLGTIQLIPSTVYLKEVSVTVPQFKLSSEGLQTNVAGTLLSKAGTANDILKQLPNIQGSDGNFTVFGKGKPLIFINGKEVRNNIELETLSSEDVISVKVITNPGAQYDNTVKAVIQIKTKRKSGEGLGVLVRSLYKQASRSGFTEQVSLNYQKEKLNLFTTLFYNNSYLKQTQSNIQTIYGKLEQHGNARLLTHSQSLYGSTGFNYLFNDKNSIGASYTINREPGDNVTNYNNTVFMQGGTQQKVSYIHDINMPKGTNHQLDAYYNGKIGDLQIDYNFDYLYSKSIKEQLTTQQPEGEKLSYITTSNQTHNKLLASKIVLSYPLGSGTIDAGSEYTYTRRNETFINVEQLLNDTHDQINESNIAAFAKYGLQWKKWMLSAGIRYQFTRSDYFEKDVKINEQSQANSKWLPEASISYGGEKFQAQLSYGAKMTRPSYYMLASNVQYNDQYTYEGGNPLLQPSIYHNLSLDLMYSWVYLAIGYVHKNNEILNIDKPYSNNSILFTYDNIDKVDEVIAMLNLSPSFGCWKPVYSASVSKQFLDSKLLGVTEKLEKPMFLFKLNNSFNLPQNWIIGIDYSYNTSGHSGANLVKQSSRLNLRINKSLFKKQLSLSLQANDIFKGSYNTNIYYGKHMGMNIRNYSDSRNIQASVIYRFNYGRNKYKGNSAGKDEKERL